MVRLGPASSSRRRDSDHRGARGRRRQRDPRLSEDPRPAFVRHGALCAGPASQPGVGHSYGDASRTVEFLPLDREDEGGAGAVFLPTEKVLFGGPAVFNGTHTNFSGKDTRLWIEDLERLDRLAPQRVVPGFGSWGGRNILGRLGFLLSELRSQVAHGIAEGYSLKDIQGQVRIPVGLFGTGRRIQNPALTISRTSFESSRLLQHRTMDKRSNRQGPRPHALYPHRRHACDPPEPIQQALAPMFERAGVVAHFTVDVTALSAENLRLGCPPSP